MSVDDKLARLAEQKLIAIKNFHLDLMRKADRLRLPDNYIKGTGNNKAVMGDFNNPLNPLNNGINPNTNTCTAIPQNAAGFYGRPACLSERPTIIPMTQSEGAHTSDASANGTESDIFSRSNGGIDFSGVQDHSVPFPDNRIQRRDANGNIDWSGMHMEPSSNVPINIQNVNGKPVATGFVDTGEYNGPFGGTNSVIFKGGSKTYAAAGQGAVYDIKTTANQGEIDPSIQYSLQQAVSGSEQNEIELKENANNENCRLTLDANNGKITITITGGPDQYNSTIVMTGNDITCTTHTFKVIANDEIDFYAGEQSSSIVMIKDNITMHSKVINENGDNLITMDAKLIMQNCGGGTSPAPTVPEIPGGDIGAIGGDIGSISEVAAIDVSNIAGDMNIGNITEGLNLDGVTDFTNGLDTDKLTNGLSDLTNQIGGADFSNISSNFQSQLSGMADQAKNAVGGLIENSQGLIQNVQQTATELTGKINTVTEQVKDSISAGVDNLTNATTELSAQVGNISQKSIFNAEIVTSSIGDFTSSTNQASSLMDNIISNQPSINNLPIDLSNMPVSLPDNFIINNNGEVDPTKAIITFADVNIKEYFLNEINKINTLNDEEKTLLVNYLCNIYDLKSTLKDIIDFIKNYPLIQFYLYIARLYANNMHNYMSNWSQIILDDVKETNLITVHQLENNMAQMKINVLRFKGTLNKYEENIREQMIESINTFLIDYIDSCDNLIKIKKEYSKKDTL